MKTDAWQKRRDQRKEPRIYDISGLSPVLECVRGRHIIFMHKMAVEVHHESRELRSRIHDEDKDSTSATENLKAKPEIVRDYQASRYAAASMSSGRRPARQAYSQSVSTTETLKKNPRTVRFHQAARYQSVSTTESLKAKPETPRDHDAARYQSVLELLERPPPKDHKIKENGQNPFDQNQRLDVDTGQER
ncbi:MAG: hypothetical protein Q9223_005766, partial [Gallowayella weberi]